jgi:hypothetical protein
MDVQFTTHAPARKAGRYTLSESRTVPCGDMERVSVGVDRAGEQALVFESGRSQAGIPLHAVATAIASGKVIPLDALASALKETGQLDKLAKAVEKVGA